MSVDPHLAEGVTIDDRYLLLEQIGRGGVGTVWRATDRGAPGELALKIIKPRGRDGEPSRNTIGRFIREAHAMARLRSPHVVRVLRHGKHGAMVYLAMELLAGVSLRGRLKADGKLDPVTTLRLMTHLGRAVALAHQRGVVHRDLKPANVFLCHGEDRFTAKVLDFGMAKSLATPLMTADPVQTERGKMLGTPFYMSPEQARGMMSVDHRTDLWAMGVIAFECLCGERPFPGKSLASVFSQIAMGSIPVPSQLAEVPPGFDGWIERALDRDVQRRFQSARVMLEELHEALGGHTIRSATAAPTLESTLTDVMLPALQPAAFGERTIRRAPPTGSSSFVGREEQLADVKEAMASHCRVLTLRGSPGVGKGRLARELGSRHRALFPGGVWLCNLEQASHPEAMWVAIASSLGVQLSDADPRARVGRALSGLGRILLILERVDGIRKHLAPTLAHWLTAVPHAVFAVTSEQPLEVPAERVVRLPPLDTPPDATESYEGLTEHTAAKLFLRRALSYDRRLLDHADQAPAVAAICRRAGGLPLALEVLAACIGRQSPREIARGMQQALVHAGGTTIIRPAGILAAAIAWSVEQLSEPERAALAQCAVFRGGFTGPAAEAVVDLDDWPDAPTVAELVERFGQLGLLTCDRAAWSEPRFDMHPAVRAVCTEWLDGGGTATGDADRSPTIDGTAAARRHLHYYAQQGSAEALEALVCRGGWQRRARYVAEWGNTQRALETAKELDQADHLGLASLAVAAIQRMVGREATAAATLLEVLAHGAVPDHELARCAILRGRALMACRRYPQAAETLAQAGNKARGQSDPRCVVAALCAQAELLLTINRGVDARTTYQEALAIAQQHEDRPGRAAACLGLAAVLDVGGDPEEGLRHLAAALADYRRMGARRRQAETLERLGVAEGKQGRYQDGHGHLEEALAIHRELGDRHAEARSLGTLGEQTLQAGRLTDAHELLQQAAGRSGEVGAGDLEGRYLAALGSLHTRRRDFDLAWQALTKAERLVMGDDIPEEQAGVLLRRAEVEVASGRAEGARATMHRIESLIGELGPLAAAQLRAKLSELERSLADVVGR
ncbi:MAG: protein kinase [Deltaproteobacteria bacterium]|nr:protein kinase [Deltaproteobacteria bacterium]